jgi:ubiquinone/menaquinone biosynthesis C-methylase UbiE
LHLPVPPPGSRVLELGCGSGKTAAWLAGRDLDLVAVDVSHAALRMNCPAKEGFTRYALAAADARQLPFRDGIFDRAFAVHILGHLDNHDRRRAAAELVRVVKHGGSIVFRGFSSRDFRFGKGDETEPGTFRRGNGIITHYFLDDEVPGLFPSLTPVSIEPGTWTMRVAGVDLPREEITAIFLKP